MCTNKKIAENIVELKQGPRGVPPSLRDLPAATGERKTSLQLSVAVPVALTKEGSEKREQGTSPMLSQPGTPMRAEIQVTCRKQRIGTPPARYTFALSALQFSSFRCPPARTPLPTRRNRKGIERLSISPGFPVPSRLTTPQPSIYGIRLRFELQDHWMTVRLFGRRAFRGSAIDPGYTREEETDAP
jgi:hypothetical protein